MIADSVNPKTIVGATKVPLHLVPPSASHFLALAFGDGAPKYGPYNWRETSVSALTYVAAARRHIDAYFDGEDEAQDSGVPHLAHAMACLAVMLDASTIGNLVDDRPAPGASPRLQSEYHAMRAAKAAFDTAANTRQTNGLLAEVLGHITGADLSTPDAIADAMLPDATPPQARLDA